MIFFMCEEKKKNKNKIKKKKSETKEEKKLILNIDNVCVIFAIFFSTTIMCRYSNKDDIHSL